jgi:hypothetical protein
MMQDPNNFTQQQFEQQNQQQAAGPGAENKDTPTDQAP